MGYVGNKADSNYSSIDKQIITGNGGTSYTLSHAVANANEIEVFVNNVRQNPGVAYTVNNAALSMTGAVANSDSFYVVFIGKAVQTKVPVDGSVTTAKLATGVAVPVSGGTFSGTLGVTGVLTTTAATVFNGGFTANAASTISTADNGTQLTLISTDTDANAGPHLKLYRNATGADNDALGQVEFTGKDDAGNDFIFAQIESYISDASNGAEAGYLEIFRGVGGTERVSGMILSPTETVFNENSGDIDFRVESDTSTHALFVQGSDGNVGIGTTSPGFDLDIVDSTTASNTNAALNLSHATKPQLRFVQTSNNSRMYLGMDTNDLVVRDDNGAERVRFEQNGNVGIGTSSPQSELHLSTASSPEIRLTDTTNSVEANFYTNDTVGSIGSKSNHPFILTTNNAERMRITGVGKLGFGDSQQILNGGGALASFTFAGAQGVFISTVNQAGGQCMGFVHQGSSVVGSINITSSSTSYATSSDYRLKENVDYTWDATTRLKQLKPARFNFIVDETNTLVDGFLAHEVSSVVPEAITGTKDAMKDEEYEVTPAVMDGDTVVTEAVMGTRSVPDMQGIDQSKLVPLLIKTIQELEARITALEV